MLEFRWIALIALWTLIAGPMFDSRMGSSSGPQPPAVSASAKARYPR